LPPRPGFWRFLGKQEGIISAVAAMLGVLVAVVAIVVTHRDAQPRGDSPGARVEISRPSLGATMQAGEMFQWLEL
jgi:hypothetical protein